MLVAIVLFTLPLLSHEISDHLFKLAFSELQLRSSLLRMTILNDSRQFRLIGNDRSGWFIITALLIQIGLCWESIPYISLLQQTYVALHSVKQSDAALVRRMRKVG